MTGNIYIFLISMMVLFISIDVKAESVWTAPFNSTENGSISTGSQLSLDDVFQLVASANPALKSFEYQLIAAESNLKQAGLWANPELGVEFEEVGWDAPGFKEFEFSISLAQDIEFFGQRGARKNIAQAQIDNAELQVKLLTFDLYLETKQRYYALAHAQQSVRLSYKSVELAREIVENTNYRLERGASMQSEFLLAQLEEQRALLALDQAKLEVNAAEAILVSLWNGKVLGMKVTTGAESDFNNLFNRIALLSNGTDSTRDIIQKRSELEILRAEKAMAIAEARPAVTLSGGFKRLEVNNSKSFIFGVSLPIPLFNRNQGKQKSLDAQLRSLEYDLERSRTETISNINSHAIHFKNLVHSHGTLDSLLLPTAEKAYRTLQQAYEAGRVPFTQLLEAERALNDLNFEHNDLLLMIQEQIIAMESLTGITMHVTKEN